MCNIIETLIYLLAVMGIIVTTMSFFEVFSSKYFSTYKIFNKNSMKNEKVEIIVSMKNITEDRENEIIDTLMNGRYTNLEEVVDTIKIQKE